MDIAAANHFRLDLMALHRRLREEHSSELPLNDVLVLGAIDRLGPNALPSQIATALAMARPNTTAVLRRLEANGLAQVTADLHDGRRRTVNLTARGRDILAKDRAEREAWLVRAADSVLTSTEVKQLLAAGALMRKLADYRPTP